MKYQFLVLLCSVTILGGCSTQSVLANERKPNAVEDTIKVISAEELSKDESKTWVPACIEKAVSSYLDTRQSLAKGDKSEWTEGGRRLLKSFDLGPPRLASLEKTEGSSSIYARVKFDTELCKTCTLMFAEFTATAEKTQTIDLLSNNVSEPRYVCSVVKRASGLQPSDKRTGYFRMRDSAGAIVLETTFEDNW